MSSLPSYTSAPSAPLSRSSSSGSYPPSSSPPDSPSPLSVHDSQSTNATHPPHTTTVLIHPPTSEPDPRFGFEIPEGMMDQRVEKGSKLVGVASLRREYHRDLVRYHKERVRDLKRIWVLEHGRGWFVPGEGGVGINGLDREIDIRGRRGMERTRRGSDDIGRDIEAPFYGGNIGSAVEANYDEWLDDSEVQAGTSSEESIQHEYDGKTMSVNARKESREAAPEGDERQEQSDDERGDENDGSSSPNRTHFMDIVTKHLAISALPYRPTRPMVYQTLTDISDAGTEEGAAMSSKREEPLISSTQGSGLECFPRFEEMRAMVGDEKSWWTKSRVWIRGCCLGLMGC